MKYLLAFILTVFLTAPGWAAKRNIVLFVGYQAEHTLGRRMIEGSRLLKIYGEKVALRAEVDKINGLSAHGDAEDLRWWFEKLRDAGGAGQAFIVHGEDRPAEALRDLITDCCDETPVIPQFGDSFEV